MSLMEIIFTVEEVRVLFFVVDTFDLDRRMVEIVFAAHQVSNLSKRLEGFRGDDVAGHCILALGNLPHMDIVYVFDCFRVQLLNVVR